MVAVVVPIATVVEDDIAVTAGSGVVLGPLGLVAGPVPTPAVLVGPVEPEDVRGVLVVTVGGREVVSSEEFSEESLEAHFSSHSHFCSRALQSPPGPPKPGPPKP